MVEDNETYFTKMADELRAVREKYKLPKGLLFVPDRLEMSIKRTSYDKLHLSYNEFFDYLPEMVLNLVIPMTINMMVQIGVPRERIEQISKNGIKMELDGDATLITGMILSELLIQKHFTEEEPDKILAVVKGSTKALTDTSNLAFEWNDKNEKDFFNNLAQMSAVIQSNPSIVFEMQEIVNKYTKQIEQVRALMEKKNEHQS